jgi:uncharacterized membrane protein YhaH (DUF805 family)
MPVFLPKAFVVSSWMPGTAVLAEFLRSDYVRAVKAVDALDLVRHALDPRGRCNRHGFLVVALILLAFQILGGALLVLAGADLQGGLAIALNMPLFVVGTMAVFKRLHDIGRSGWWVPGAIVFWIVGSMVINLTASLIIGPDVMLAAVAEQSALFWMMFATIALPAFGGLLWLHATAGQSVANRHGAVPGVLGFVLPVTAANDAGLLDGATA